MLPKRNRLPLSSEKERMKRFDFFLEGEFLKVRFRKNDLAYARSAVVISKKGIALAVKRNRVKRVLVGVLEKNLDIKKGYDISVWVKKGIEKPFAKKVPLIARELDALLKKIGQSTRQELDNRHKKGIGFHARI